MQIQNTMQDVDTLFSFQEAVKHFGKIVARIQQ